MHNSNYVKTLNFYNDAQEVEYLYEYNVKVKQRTKNKPKKVKSNNYV